MLIIKDFKVLRNEHTTKALFITTNEKNDYEQLIEFRDGKIEKWNCTCKFGSVFRFSKINIERKIKCRHIKVCIRLLVFLHYLRPMELE